MARHNYRDSRGRFASRGGGGGGRSKSSKPSSKASGATKGKLFHADFGKTGNDRIRQAEIMFGTGSAKHKQAIKKFSR